MKRSFTILPGIEAKGVNQGCLCCPTPTLIANLEKQIDLLRDIEPKTMGDMETLAAQDPDHDWRVTFYGPLHGETYQRHGANMWVMIESNIGFA